MEILFATSNVNKFNEVKWLLPEDIKLISLQEVGFKEDIPEEEPTIAQNSFFKANYVYQKYKLPCLAEDTGLEVFALNNEPGVRSARYAGSKKSSDDNIDLLLKNLKGVKNRKAQFLTVATFITKNTSKQYRGVVKGHIVDQRKGNGGFGYDPVFVPAGFDQTFAEMDRSTKSLISHRGIAMRKCISHMKEM